MGRFCEFLGQSDVQRVDWVMSEYRRDIMNAIALAADQGLSCGGLCCEDVAWAFSWNAASEGFQEKWPPETTQMGEIWAYFSRTRETQKMGKYSYLSEMAWSVSCEERADWHRPDTRLNREIARKTSDGCFIPRRLMPYFELNPSEMSEVDFKRFDEITKAYHDFWHAYWKHDAAQRWCCLGTILGRIYSSYWIIHQGGNRPLPISTDNVNIDDSVPRPVPRREDAVREADWRLTPGELGVFLQKSDQQGDEGSSRYHECLRQMGCHEKIYADLFFLYGYDQGNLVDIFGVAPPQITNAKTDALSRLLRCERFLALVGVSLVDLPAEVSP